MNQSCTIILEDAPAPGDIHFIQDRLRDYNLLHAEADNHQPFAIFLRAADNSLMGDLLGGTYWGWLHVDVLWIHETLRRQGYGHALLAAAEEEARRRGCRYAHLDTMSFQALGFYEQQGYQVFGKLDDLPAGHYRYFLKKALK
jgi:GNAT superfamily N-acetyltransferase